MKRGSKIRRILVAFTWCLLGAATLVLLGAAVRNKTEKLCKGYEIDINSSDKGLWFVDKKDVVNIITANGESNIRGKKTTEFNLRALETNLEKSSWIEDAQLFFDNNSVLQVKIREREPVARIFTTNGSSFYIDTAATRLPLSEKTITKLPVFTGFPVTGKKIAKKDSALARDVIALSLFISKNAFWQAQVAQVEIKDKNFEIVPLIGDQVIEFGTAENHEEKFNRLLLFYRQVLSKVGMNKYSALRLQFDNQVVAVKKEGFISKADSLKVISNIESMIADAHENEVKMLDSVAKSQAGKTFVQKNTTKN
jgi:cell division protein FtsQ